MTYRDADNEKEMITIHAPRCPWGGTMLNIRHDFQLALIVHTKKILLNYFVVLL